MKVIKKNREYTLFKRKMCISFQNILKKIHLNYVIDFVLIIYLYLNLHK
jgi:hypothetical protein